MQEINYSKICNRTIVKNPQNCNVVLFHMSQCKHQSRTIAHFWLRILFHTMEYIPRQSRHCPQHPQQSSSNAQLLQCKTKNNGNFVRCGENLRYSVNPSVLITHRKTSQMQFFGSNQISNIS